MIITADKQTTEYIYTIDGNDIIRSVNEDFESFARANDGRELAGGSVIGRSLWNYVTGELTKGYYKNLISAVRENRESITLPFRCDAPSLRREMIMELRPGEDESIQFICRMNQSAPREPVEAISKTSKKSDRFLSMCSWCKRVELPDQGWMDIEEAIQIDPLLSRDPYPQFTHGICSECMAQQKKLIAKE
ncbi:MAG: hypothetical protein K9N46_16370 [Candidatus Marinimicrobia bacterium]|nr:hypothetical protein [Candidatus Neomarinimicrobiota bacterium]MCF7830329.1 hypothetical protein [Candidatus Neomarinimicrobiota bacterium]MCF7882306.1 hypothetical protein [Candidatus Neomarinimicrobiota bacterium]